MNIRELAETYEPYIIRQRRYFHAHPELSFQERNTCERIRQELVQMQIPVTDFTDNYGLIGTIEGTRPGPVLMLRADIDALPVTEHTGLAFASENPGVMHACGHDCHIAMLLGAAKILMETRANLCGTVKLLFQSGEESCHGSTYYVEQGCLDNVSAIFALHIWGTLKAPYFALHEGGCMASCDNFQITVNGTSAHGAAPHLGHDAIVAASSIIMNLQTMVSRQNDPQNAMVLTVGTMEGGEAFNILPNRAILNGTIRTYDPAIRDGIEDRLRAIAMHTADALGCTADVTLAHCFPAIYNNDRHLNQIVRQAAVNLYGQSCIREMKPLMSSDDFSRFAQIVPSYYGYLGACNSDCCAVYPNHSDHFTVDESALKRGAALYAQVALSYSRDKIR